MDSKYILELYKLDNEFTSSYHGMIGWTAEDCAKDTWEAIKTLELYKTDYGYIAVNRMDLLPRLAGFFIKPNCRNKETFNRFFEEIFQLMPETFITSVHSSNKPAIKFLSKKGEITYMDNTTTHIIFRQENR